MEKLKELIKSTLNIPIVEHGALVTKCATFSPYYIDSALYGNGTTSIGRTAIQIDLWYPDSEKADLFRDSTVLRKEIERHKEYTSPAVEVSIDAPNHICRAIFKLDILGVKE